MGPDTPKSEWPYLVYAAGFEMFEPMRVIQGYARMLESERSGPLSEIQRKMIAEIVRYVLNALAQVDRLQALGRIEYEEACDGASQRSTVALGVILGEVVAEVTARRIEPSSLDLLPADGDDHVVGDPTLLKHALRGLIGLMRRVILQTNPEFSLAIKIFDRPDRSQRWVVIAESSEITKVLSVAPERLQPYNLPFGLHADIAYARRVLARYGGDVWSLPDGGVGAVVALPRV